jgi:hypothetical protein
MGDGPKNKFEQIWDTILIIVLRFPIMFGFIAGVLFVNTGSYEFTTRKLGQAWDYVEASEMYQTNMDNLKGWINE